MQSHVEDDKINNVKVNQVDSTTKKPEIIQETPKVVAKPMNTPSPIMKTRKMRKKWNPSPILGHSVNEESPTVPEPKTPTPKTNGKSSQNIVEPSPLPDFETKKTKKSMFTFKSFLTSGQKLPPPSLVHQSNSYLEEEMSVYNQYSSCTLLFDCRIEYPVNYYVVQSKYLSVRT